ncbi:MAG: glutamine amidotransferase [Polyangiaceae bacterium]|nr:glutamine amidotransferase [Polyangiaceae bacterium]
MSRALDHVRIVRLYPDLLGTYGDDGNAIVLAQRSRWRGIDATIIDVRSGDEVPDDGAVYVIGGGEDGPQTTAAEQLAASGGLHRALDSGAALLAVCAGFQIMGQSFLGPDGRRTKGLGLIDCETGRRPGPRRVGEVVADAEHELALPTLTGYENHAGTTELGADARPFARVRRGHGNGVDDASEGAWANRVVGTYLHGPVLARNPALADRLLGWVLDTDLDPLAGDELVEQLRAQRFAAASHDDGATRGRRHWPLRQLTGVAPKES